MELELASQEITAFRMPSSHYKLLKIPFGLKAAPLMLQRMINYLFAHMLGNCVCILDLIIASKDLKTHSKTLKVVLQRLQEAGLKVKLVKCEFLKEKSNFLAMK